MMIFKKIILITAGILYSLFSYSQLVVSQLSLEAHRGGRGLFPENTIEAMKLAMHLPGVNTLEMDLCISKDKKIVVSHDVYFHQNITTTPQGKYLSPEEAKAHLLYQMNYDSIRKYDVGLKPHPDFPKQQRFATIKPLLTDLIDETEKLATKQGREIYYNMEIKSGKSGDGKENPFPEEFVDIVYKVLQEKGIVSKTVIQSFDRRPLQVLHRKYPDVKLSLLTGKSAIGPQQMIEKLGFNPAVYSPEYNTVSDEMIKYCHERNIKVLPWTVNTKEEIMHLINLGVDGIISDYPDLFNDVSRK
ncbi:glycerophosphodiester phosphodiesterase family protein [Pedobacter arcticus]|uniref:glycerophosphodiester phosphodiesterase family protein n=1 Tax=Pedobacter arcticus TaxID=752140 RepID=UPI00035DD837|nr:glycerophosphodiester phosphodiesterase family protein [Pedobacter arcticus]